MIVSIPDDFHLQKIAESGQCFRAQAIAENYFRFITSNHVLYIRHQENTHYEVSCTSDEWNNIWFSYFDLQHCYSKIRRKIPRKDSFLWNAAREGSGIRILQQDPWETTVSFLISQRKSIPAIRGCIEKLCRQFGQQFVTPFECIYAFPSASALAKADETGLCNCGLGYRLSYVRAISQKAAAEPDYFEKLGSFTDDGLLSELRKNKGIGVKVASCIALFAFGRTAVSPVDTWINKIITQIYQNEDPFPSYGKYAGIMQQYAFLYALRHKNVFWIEPSSDS